MRNDSDRYSTLDDMKLAVKHDLRQYQSRAECPIAAILIKITRFQNLATRKHFRKYVRHLAMTFANLRTLLYKSNIHYFG